MSDTTAEIRRADPRARRHAVVFAGVATLVGAALIVTFQRYEGPLREWFLSEPGAIARRATFVLLALAVLLWAPPAALAFRLWWLGAKTLAARQFPPPGYRVIRDTPVRTGPAAVSRGRGLKVIALCLAFAVVVLWLLLWRLASALGESVLA